MTGRKSYFVTAGLWVALAAWSAWLALLLTRPEGPRVEQLEAELNESLPDGSTKEQALAWFASHGIRVFELRWGGRDFLEAHVPNSTLIEPAEICIYLKLDWEGRVVERCIFRFVY
jgi:hypothetical protein